MRHSLVGRASVKAYLLTALDHFCTPRKGADDGDARRGVIDHGVGAGARADGRRTQRLKISSSPLVAWSLALPTGSITWPSTAIGLFQWPAGVGSVAISFPLAGW